MGNSTSLVSKFQEFSNYAVNHGLVTDPQFNNVRIAYSEWYQSYEDDGTKVPKEGMSKYAAGIIIYQQIDEQLTAWRNATVNNEVKNEGITQEEIDAILNAASKVPVSTVVGTVIGKGIGIAGVSTVKASVATASFVKNVVAPTVATGTKVAAKGFWNTMKEAGKAAKNEYKNRR